MLIDWPGIRAAAVTIGVRKAARQAGRDLPPDEQERLVYRALKRSQREGWVTASEQVKADATPQGKPLSSHVLNGVDLLRETMSEDDRETKLSLSRSFRRLAKDAEAAPLAQAADVLTVTKGAALVHGWASSGSPSLRLTMFGPSGPVVDVESSYSPE